jgi:gluconolactonase
VNETKIIAEGLRFPEGPVWMPDGSLLCVEMAARTVTRIWPDGRHEPVLEVPGCPNGLALGPDGALYVCNNGGMIFREGDGLTRTIPGVPEGYEGGWIERIDLKSLERRVLYTHCGDYRFHGPNDIVFDRRGGFYFTDYGKLHPRFRPNGGLYYALADGSSVVEVAFPMITPNGVGLSPDEQVVYVAESETGRCWAFDLDTPGKIRRRPFPSPHGGRCVVSMPGMQRFDSLAVDGDGNVCVATIYPGGIAVISPEGELVRELSTGDPITTNICFGGPDLRNAFITLSGTGRMLQTDWPTRGLKLNFG